MYMYVYVYVYTYMCMTQVTVTELLQTQAYIIIYRKMDHDGGTRTNGPRNSRTIQKSTIKKPKLSHEMEYRPVESLLPGPRVKFPNRISHASRNPSGGIPPNLAPHTGRDFLKRT